MSFYVEFSFSAQVALLDTFLGRSRPIVEAIESRALNVQSRRGFPIGDRHHIEQVLSSCFFDSAPRDFGRLREQLSTAHRADGFEPVQQEGGAHDFDAAQLVAHAHSYWSNSRWPGRNRRMAYAQTLLQPYFAVAEHISQSFDEDERLQIHFASALLAGGHLRSQLRYRARESQATEKHGLTRTHHSADDPEILSVTRNSNSIDLALLMRDLVALLEAYHEACVTGASDRRRTLSDAILQGLSADPELLLTRLDVLGPAAMIEEVFVERKEDGRIGYTEFGNRHLDALSRYRELISALAGRLNEDAQHLDPARRVYSPFAIVYGFCADILSNIVTARLTSPETIALSLEDMFSRAGALEDKLATARQWEGLPRHNSGRPRFEYSTEWAAQIHRVSAKSDSERSEGRTIPGECRI